MSYQELARFKHRITLTTQELALLADRLVPISPMGYDLQEFAILRGLYGTFGRFVTQDAIRLKRQEGG